MATSKRLKQRIEVAAKLSPWAAQQFRGHLIAGWSASFVRQYRASRKTAEAFWREKTAELRQLGGTDADVRAFSVACEARLLAAQERAPQVFNAPAHLVSNYEAVELFELTEVRRR